MRLPDNIHDLPFRTDFGQLEEVDAPFCIQSRDGNSIELI